MKKRRIKTGVCLGAASQHGPPEKRRHGRYILHYILIAAFVLSVGAALSMTVFFKIEKVEVAGNTKYPRRRSSLPAASRRGRTSSGPTATR